MLEAYAMLVEYLANGTGSKPGQSLLPQCSLQCFQGPGGRCILLAQSAQGMVLGLSHERSPFLPLSTLPPFFAFGYSIDKWPTSLTPTESKLPHSLAINANNVCTASQTKIHLATSLPFQA
ncbi:MAG: hypothetical protein AUG51_02285 [Acidobacteria bacterium 13_1_20CM_3_53_8]|nr:MAG: hypothetical protein AUG51_02285 [Acidobacteria bacterium 13_1_20CM_3_53_8]